MLSEAVSKTCPEKRNVYRDDGYEDDAMIVTEEIYNTLLKEYEGSKESEDHADLDHESVSLDFVGKKWVVVVDYHT